MKTCNAISRPVQKKDHKEKTEGSAQYIADIKFSNMIYGKMIRSDKMHAKIKQIILPELPDGYCSISQDDVPGHPLLKVITIEQPIFASDEVRFCGEGILMLAGPDKTKLEEIAAAVVIEYQELPAVLSLSEATESVAAYEYQKGDIQKAFEEADQILEETFETGYQEQAYLEPQGMTGIFEGGKSSVYGSMQCPYYIKSAVMQAMALEEDQVQIVQTTTGGGFGGKEDYPSLIGCQVAVAAKKAGSPVQLILNRREDMGTTPKRHPAVMTYKASIKNGYVTGMEVEVLLDAGAYAGLSSVVLQRSLIAAIGVYCIENLHITGKAMVTNLVPNGAFRGFGAPQTFFAIETMMNHLAAALGKDPLSFKMEHMVKQGDKTSTNGRFHHSVPLEPMILRVQELSDYKSKYEQYAKQETGRFRKGIGISLFLHGCGFTGSAEKDHIRSRIRLVKYKNDKVEILVSNTEIGQGLKTTFSKIVATILSIPLDHVMIENPDTDRVPDSGPTVASRSLMIVGKLLERASEKMKAQWESGKEIEIVEDYQHPEMIPWSLETFQGDAYPTYSWGVNVIEVETDLMTAMTKIKGIWAIFDIGTAIDDMIMKGQCEGGILQGLGYGSIEHMDSQTGRIRQSSFTDYMIPTAMDTVPITLEFIENLYDGGPFGAKGAGELSLIGAAPAFEAAVENAIGKQMSSIPVTPERIMEVLDNDSL
ncbi:MAG: xanthine dehydrogenase family protein molybdopterin-binding subunit [Lachnospiraceae bacterium]